jgi:exopolysaccharide production protein ExoY
MEPVFAAILLLIATPAILVVAAIIAILCRRTPLVRHRRVGWRGVELPMLKFRTMWEPKQDWAPVFTIEEISDVVPASKRHVDDRVSSRFAAWCRRYSIDEIPQLYHVARGHMSLVGPRPITRAELEEHYGRSAQTVLTLRPGLTGLWQVMGRSKCTYAQRLRLDLWLSRHASAGLYFRILLRSIPGVLQGHDAY